MCKMFLCLACSYLYLRGVLCLCMHSLLMSKWYSHMCTEHVCAYVSYIYAMCLLCILYDCGIHICVIYYTHVWRAGVYFIYIVGGDDTMSGNMWGEYFTEEFYLYYLEI